MQHCNYVLILKENFGNFERGQLSAGAEDWSRIAQTRGESAIHYTINTCLKLRAHLETIFMHTHSDRFAITIYAWRTNPSACPKFCSIYWKIAGLRPAIFSGTPRNGVAILTHNRWISFWCKWDQSLCMPRKFLQIVILMLILPGL